MSAIGNDYEFTDLFARQVAAFAKPGDVLIVLTTSGKSRNIRLYVKRVFISGGCRGVQRGPEQAGWLAGRLGITSTDALQCHPPRHTVPYCAAPPRVLPCARRRV